MTCASYSSVCVYWNWPRRLKKLQAFLILLSAFTTHLLLGAIYTYGNLQPYLVSYIREKSHPSSLRFTQSTYMYSCHYGINAVGIIVGSFIEQKAGPRMSILIGGSIATSGLCLSFFAVKYSFWLLMFTFGALYGFGAGTVYAASIVCLLRWFPKWAGVATGFVVSAHGFSTLIFAPIQTGFINPHDQLPNFAPYTENEDEKYFTQKDIIDRVPFIFLIQGSIFALISFLTSVLMVNPIQDLLDEKSTEQDHSSDASDSVAIKHENNARPCQLLTEINFYLVWSVSAINVATFGVIGSLYKSYGLEVLKASDFFLTLLSTVSGFSSVFGRILFGLMADRVDYEFGFVLQSGMMTILISTLYMTSVGWPIVYFIWMCGLFLCYGGYSILFSVTVLRAFGKEHLNANYALFSTSVLTGVIFSGLISDFCIDLFGWHGMFLLLSGLSFIQLLSSVLYRRKIYTTKRYTLEIYNMINLAKS